MNLFITYVFVLPRRNDIIFFKRIPMSPFFEKTRLTGVSRYEFNPKTRWTIIFFVHFILRKSLRQSDKGKKAEIGYQASGTRRHAHLGAWEWEFESVARRFVSKNKFSTDILPAIKNIKILVKKTLVDTNNIVFTV